MTDMHQYGVRTVAAMLEKGELTSVELVEALLARIAELDGQLHSFVTVDADGALAAAAQADAERSAGAVRGPLHGVPLAVKDNLDTAGLLTTFNSPALADNVPAVDTPAVARLRAAGAIIVGKTNLNEFGWSLPSDGDLNPPVMNPWQPAYQSVGSSSGSGSAVAGGFVPAALGTDGGGSTRLPAGQHGLVGLKPSAGAVPRERGYNSLSVVGVLARSADDAVALYDVIADVPVGPVDPTAARGLRLGVPRDLLDAVAMEEDVATSFAESVQVLESIGVTVAPVSLPAMQMARAASFTLINAGSFTTVEPLLREKFHLFGPSAQRYALTGAFVRGSDVLRALRVAELAEASIRAGLDGFDGILTPVSPVVTAEAARVPSEHRKGANSVFTAPFNLIGWPAVAIPAGIASVGLPMGVQVAGRRGAERMLTNLAAAYEEASGWRDRCAPIR